MASERCTPSKDLTFYYRPMSTACVTEVVLNELGIEGKRIKMDFSESGTRGQDYMRNINPNGKVPAIEHEGTSIWEAAAITMYLGDVFGQEKNLWPLQGPKRGEAMKWVAWASGCLPAAGTRVSSDLPPGAPGAIEDEALQEYVDPSERSPQRLQKARDALTQLLKVLDGALAGKEYLLGEFTLADAHVAQYIVWFTYMNIDMSSYKNLKPWLDRCMLRPAVAKMEDMDAAPECRSAA